MVDLPVVLRRRSTQNRVLMTAALILVAGGIAAAFAFVGGGKAIPQHYSSTPPKDVSKIPPKVKLSESAAKVAQKFIATNVVRKNLSEGYKIVGPNLKEGLTLKEWLTGEIPVVPYQATALGKIPIQVIYSYPTQAVLRVFLLPKPGVKAKAATFWLTLQRVGKGPQTRWLVNGWTPYLSVPLPDNRTS